MSVDFTEYILSPAQAGRSPSWLASRAAAVRTLADACAPTPKDRSDPWGWRTGTDRLHREVGVDDRALFATPTPSSCTWS